MLRKFQSGPKSRAGPKSLAIYRQNRMHPVYAQYAFNHPMEIKPSCEPTSHMSTETHLAFPAGVRSAEESVHFGVGHRIRIEILAALHEGPASRSQLAKMLRLPRHKLRYHIYELQKDGSIEIAARRKIGNLTEVIYRVNRLAFFSEEDWLSLSVADRQVTSALILQATWVEALASLWAGKFHSDPRVAVIWNRIVLDAQGRAELLEEQKRSWDRISGIEAIATTRRLKSKAPGIIYVVASLGFERSRSTAPAPQVLESGVCLDAPLRPPDASGRTVEEALSHSVGHRIRVELLAALHEGPATASQLSRMIGQPLNLTDYHIDELVSDGAVRVVDTTYVRNIEQPIYGVVKLPFYTDDDWKHLSREERQVFSAIAIRAAIAEAQASLWAGKFALDPQVMVAWNRISLDPLGREELADEQAASWYRICGIEKRAIKRLEASNERGKVFVVTIWGFERSRTSAPPPLDER